MELYADDSLREVLIKAAEDNPSAVKVLMKIMQKFHYAGFSIILQLDDMNIRGTQIFVGYKYHCRGNLDRFIECINNKDSKMLETINNEGLKGKYPHKAVPGGASSGQREFLSGVGPIAAG